MVLVATVRRDMTLPALLPSLTTTVSSSTIPKNLKLARAIPDTARSPRTHHRRQTFQQKLNPLTTRPLYVARKGDDATPLHPPQDKLRHELLNGRPGQARA